MEHSYKISLGTKGPKPAKTDNIRYRATVHLTLFLLVNMVGMLFCALCISMYLYIVYGESLINDK